MQEKIDCTFKATGVQSGSPYQRRNGRVEPVVVSSRYRRFLATMPVAFFHNTLDSPYNSVPAVDLR